MKKKFIFSTVALAFLFVVSIPKVDARTYSGYLQSPQMYQVYPKVYGNKVTLPTSYSNCRAENTGVIFTGFKTLPSYYQYEDAVIHMRLFEHDTPSAAPHERIKKYRAVYFDRELYEVQIEKYMESGLIDGETDTTCEFIMDFVASGTQGGNILEGNLITYRIFMD